MHFVLVWLTCTFFCFVFVFCCCLICFCFSLLIIILPYIYNKNSYEALYPIQKKYIKKNPRSQRLCFVEIRETSVNTQKNFLKREGVKDFALNHCTHFRTNFENGFREWRLAGWKVLNTAAVTAGLTRSGLWPSPSRVRASRAEHQGTSRCFVQSDPLTHRPAIVANDWRFLRSMKSQWGTLREDVAFSFCCFLTASAC